MLRLMILGCLLLLSLSCFLFPSAAQVTHPSEVKALRAVKSNLIDTKKFLRNWKDGDPCTSNWTGILCLDTVGADRYRHVWALQLLNMNLSGTLSPEVGQLSQLEILDFMWNDLTGSIPKEIGNLKSLRLLLLNGNNLSGFLPEELGHLKNLTRLQVDQNQISGPVPKSFGNLSAIRHIHLNNNSISGQIPPELASLPTLLHLLLDTNNLSGSLPPEFSSLPELRIIQLDNNNFSGAEIPATYGNFSKLIKLSLRNCSLQGAIPDFSRIPNLSYLDLSLNHLTGFVPSNKLSDNITTIVLSDNRLNGSIPGSFANLPLLQTLLLENNLLNGSFPTNIWQNISFDANARLTIDLRNNSISAISGDLKPPVNVTLRFSGNPICNNANTPNINQYCESEPGGEVNRESLANSTCPVQACPTDNFFEYVPESPVQCFCASPLRIGYRLKSPSFSYFPPYLPLFETYLTDALNLELYQLSIDSYSWEAGPRVGMYLKLFPRAGNANSSMFNTSEVHRIRERFMTWRFRGSDLFGPYELLNFTLLGPYSNSWCLYLQTVAVDFETQGARIGKGILAAIILGSIASAIATTAIITILITRRSRYKQISSRKHMSSKISMRIDNVKSFTFKEMVMATNNFDSSTQVGQGGYGKVYRGTLSDNTVVAIKRAEEGSLQGEKEFLTEIELLSRLHHRNLVALLGYCDEEGEQMLVYEFMPNGTLRDWLKAKAKGDLSFGMRLSIALGSAKGILYLHTEAQPPIFHRDIKASNILLDAKFTVKVADFGLSRLAPVPDDQGDVPNYVSTMVRGTPGYLDPEYFLTHKLTDKSDVYSLGVVLLELLTGMQPITHGKNIVREANVAHQSGMMFSIVDSRMGSYPSQCLERFAALALDCCHDKPEKRPSMMDVVRELENILKMLPENDVFSESSSTSTKFSGSKSASSSSNYVSRDQYVSSNISGSDLVSGVIPTISPR